MQVSLYPLFRGKTLGSQRLNNLPKVCLIIKTGAPVTLECISEILKPRFAWFVVKLSFYNTLK